MLPSKQVLNNLLGNLYEAACDAALWEEFLGQLARRCRGHSAALVMHHLVREVHTISASWNMDPEASRLYQQYYGSIDVWAMRGRDKPAGYVCTSESLCSPKELAGTQVYNDFMARYNVACGMFGLVENNSARWASLSIYRGSSSEEFRVADLDILTFLVPHMQRAFMLHFEFSGLNARAEGTEAALNMLSTGVIFLDDNGGILATNRTADELLRRKDGLRLEAGKLSASLPAESARLQAIIAGGVKTGNGKGLIAGGTILVSRESTKPLSVTVAPVQSAAVEIGQRAAAVVFVSDPDQKIEVPTQALQGYYGLTPAEARLAVLLLEGRTLNEAEELCGVTRNTAKSQLKSIFLKTGVQRQQELIRLLLRTFPLTHG